MMAAVGSHSVDADLPICRCHRRYMHRPMVLATLQMQIQIDQMYVFTIQLYLLFANFTYVSEMFSNDKEIVRQQFLCAQRDARLQAVRQLNER